PVARHNARAPAILRPCVVVAERYLGMLFLLPSVFIKWDGACRPIFNYLLTGSNQPHLSSVSPVKRPKKAS
ncbi:hypothetical protein B4U36_29730, partial [Klebsiella pneumoniae]